jgi:hypothetical protein
MNTHHNPRRCEINTAGPEEDCGRRIAYWRCKKPASWQLPDDGDAWVCEDHCLEFLRDGVRVEGLDGEPVTLDEDGEIVLAEAS